MINDPDFDITKELVLYWEKNKAWKEMLLNKYDNP